MKQSDLCFSKVKKDCFKFIKSQEVTGEKFVDKIEQLAIDRLCELFNASWANVQPHSGAQANAAVFLACLNPGDKILGFDLSHGGHLTHGSKVNFSGKLYDPYFYGVDKESGLIDYDSLEETAKKEKRKKKQIQKRKMESKRDKERETKKEGDINKNENGYLFKVLC